MDLQDSCWKGRTDAVGSGPLTVRDNFTIVRPYAIATPGSGAWAIDIAGPLPEGVAATTDAATAPLGLSA